MMMMECGLQHHLERRREHHIAPGTGAFLQYPRSVQRQPERQQCTRHCGAPDELERLHQSFGKFDARDGQGEGRGTGVIKFK
mgnify:CR=1 FL=1